MITNSWYIHIPMNYTSTASFCLSGLDMVTNSGNKCLLAFRLLQYCLKCAVTNII